MAARLVVLRRECKQIVCSFLQVIEQIEAFNHSITDGREESRLKDFTLFTLFVRLVRKLDWALLDPLATLGI